MIWICSKQNPSLINY